MSKEFLVSIKRTKWERDLQKYGNVKELKKIYRLQNHIFQKVYSSHVRQLRALEKLQKKIYQISDFIYREELSIPKVSKYPFLISFGGDNHFIYTARFAQQCIIGINSDPITSKGSLLYFDTDSFLEFYEKDFERQNYTIEKWSMIEGIIDYPDQSKISTGKCISEVIIRNEFPDSMSRYLIRIDQEDWEEQKSTGLLLSTGAGSSGWFYNSLPYSIQIFENPIFSKDANFFKSIARELGFNRVQKYKFLYCTIYETQVLQIISEMDGMIVIDSHPECQLPFTPGTKANFFLSKEKLHVIQKLK